MNSSISFSFTATVALLVGTIFLGDLTARRIPSPLAVPLDQIAPDVAGWTAVRDQKLPASTLRALDATSYLSRTYRKDSKELDLFIAFYAQQRAGESMHSPKHCLPGAGWEIWQHDSAMVSTNGKQYEVNKYSIQNSGTRMLMFYWYQSKEPHHCQRIPRKDSAGQGYDPDRTHRRLHCQDHVAGCPVGKRRGCRICGQPHPSGAALLR